MGWVSSVAQCALDFLASERCHACGASPPGAGACDGGLGTPVEVVSFAGIRLTTRVLCATCVAQVRPHGHAVQVTSRSDAPPLPVRAAFVTDERLLAIVHLLKFGRRHRLAPWLARVMLSMLPPPVSAGSPDTIVVPVPMDRAARRRRGFNQAESIARILAAGWNVPLSTRALVKVRRTRPQSALGRDERLRNLEGAFHAETAHVRGLHTLLVDDLVTTGATVHACARALRRAGAREITVVCAGYRDDARPVPGAFLQS